MLYEAAFPTSYITHWGDDWWSYAGDAKQCRELYANLIEKVTKKFKTDEYLVAFTGPGESFRKKLYPEYKFSRRADRKPPHYAALRDELCDNVVGFREPFLEADDLLGIWMTGDDQMDQVCVSIDKDMKTIPGWHYDYTKDDFVFIDRDTANLKLFTQVLTGDRVDDYPGCPGIGPKTAEKYLKLGMSREELWDTVVKLYEKAGLTKEYAESQLNCAYILQAHDYNFITKEIKSAR